MMRKLFTITFVAGGVTAVGLAMVSAQQSSGEPNSVISKPQDSSTSTGAGTTSPNTSSSQNTSGSGIGSKLESVLGRILGHSQSDLALDQLPQAVQNTIRTEVGTAPIRHITQLNINGQPVYEITFTRNNQDAILRVDQTGGVLHSNGNTVTNTPSGIGQTPASIPYWRTAPVRQPLSQASPIAYRSLPQPVRETLARYAGTSEIGDILKGSLGGMPVYQGALHPKGQRIDLRVAETGLLINDQVNARFLSEFRDRTSATGAAAGSQSGQGRWDGIQPLQNPTTISFDRLPLSVQTTVSSQTNDAPVERVIQGTLDGRTAYDVTCDQNGRVVTFRIGEDGSLLSNSAPDQPQGRDRQSTGQGQRAR